MFYATNDIIDGMTLDVTNSRLYWTDYLAGIIASVGLSGDKTSYQELVTGLSQPRALAVDEQKGYSIL